METGRIAEGIDCPVSERRFLAHVEDGDRLLVEQAGDFDAVVA